MWLPLSTKLILFYVKSKCILRDIRYFQNCIQNYSFNSLWLFCLSICDAVYKTKTVQQTSVWKEKLHVSPQ